MLEKKQTPLMQQYWSVKSEHPDKVVLFRMGDFFEMFHEDAIIAAPILNIALTQRNKKSNDETPMCGVPHHSIAGPIGKLLKAGHKVAICDQIEDPKMAKGLVKRAVTRVLTPGMVYDPDTLDQQVSNYMAAYHRDVLAFVEMSTGEAFYFEGCSFEKVVNLLNSLRPTEVVLTSEQKQQLQFKMSGFLPWHTSVFDHFEGSVPDRFKKLPEAPLRLVAYAIVMQGEQSLSNLKEFESRRLSEVMQMSATVIRHLEIFETYQGETKGGLFHAVNRTKTSGGARLLKNWLRFPLVDRKKILDRQQQVQYWHKKPIEIKSLRQVLGKMTDVERRLAKIANPNGGPIDMVALAQALDCALQVVGMTSYVQLNEGVEKRIRHTIQAIDSTLVDEPPNQLKNGGYIRKGIHEDLDQLIELAEDSQSLLRRMEQKEREQTQIASLKIRTNNVFGYYIEVTKVHAQKVPDYYIRRQTLANAERYTTRELGELEEKILSSKSKRVEMEQALFEDLKTQILQCSVDLMEVAKICSQIDVCSASAWLALEYQYRAPEFVDSGEVQILSSRHPVVEQSIGKKFVPNDVILGAGECMLLTGPNMAGKSTLMRQVASVVILAQAGLFVPAKMAKLPIFEKLFTRIGASDFLSEGLSTFMVEMKETAEMLKQANEKSLVILDEVGRGTSTYDGMSLAQSILEYLVSKTHCMTLFATHYHELTQLERTNSLIKNAHMTIKEQNGDIQFLHTLVRGAASKSYGIQVAKLAGLPVAVTRRAQTLLGQLESFGVTSHGQLNLVDQIEEEVVVEPAGDLDKWIEELKNIHVQKMTPIDALNKIAQWQQELI